MKHALEERSIWRWSAGVIVSVLTFLLVSLMGGCGNDKGNGPKPSPTVALMRAAPDTLDFGASATTQTLTIANEGAEAGSWRLSRPVAWLTYTDSGSLAAGSQQSVTVAASRAGLSTETHYARVLVYTANSVTDTVVAKLDVVPARILASRDARDTITFYCGGSTTDTFTLKNVGASSGTVTFGTLPSWLTVTPSGGTLLSQQSRSENVSVICGPLPVGTTPATIIVMTDGSNTDTVNVKAVKACVASSSARLDYNATQRRLTITIRNTCGGGLSWNPSSDRSWISFDRPNDTSLIVIVDPSTLPPGNSSGNVTIDAGQQGVLVIPVAKYVDPNPLIVIDPPALDFQTDKDSLQILISSEGATSLNWQTTSDSAWLWTEPQSSALSRTSQQYAWVKINRGLMRCGPNSARLHLTSNAANDPDITISVSANGDCFNLQGVVTDAQSKIALANAKVEIVGTSQYAYTNDTGGYFIPRIAVGAVTAKATKICFTFAQVSVSGQPGTTVTKNLGLPYSGPDGTCLNYQDYPISWWPNAGGQEQTWEIYEPLAVNMQLHFSRVRAAWCCWGWVRVVDVRDGHTIWEKSLNETDWWTGWLDTNHVRLVVHTNGSDHGIDMDKYSYYK